MPDKMLIDATHPEETRVVVLRGNRVEEFDFESANRKQLRGNIYLAKVTRVEPSLQAAFVDYGGNRHGFLAFSEIHPDYYQIPVADRQALIAQEERDQREADAEADHRARGGGGRGRGRHRQRGQRQRDDVRRSEPLADGEVAREAAEIPAGEAAMGQPSPAEFDETTADVREPAQPTAEFTAEDSAREAAEFRAGEDAIEPPPAPDGGEAVQEFATEASPQELADAAAEPAPAGEPGNGNGEEQHEDEAVESVGGADALEEVQERVPRFRRQYKIQEVIKRRQVMLVQVVKEERGTKGAALTTYLSLAGRYSVLMPNTARGGGISRKITIRGRPQPAQRNRHRTRSAGGHGRDPAHRRRLPHQDRSQARLRISAAAVGDGARSHAEIDRAEAGLRGRLAGQALDPRPLQQGHRRDRRRRRRGLQGSQDFMRMLMPSHVKNVKLYKDTQPLFTRCGIESQLDAMFSPVVQLRSGGYIVINQTEALVAIDVNSGRATREHHIEDTALKTNREAAEEIARQLRLRDLAGLIVIDFIDMDENRNNRTVERRMKDALKNDRARIQVGRISHFGLLEMSRQRIRSSVLESSTEKCPQCGGTGHVRSVSSVALQLLRALEEMLLKGATHNLIVRTRSEVALYVLNHKRAHLRVLEERFRVTLTISADATVTGQVSYIIDRGEQVHSVDAAKLIAAAARAEMPIEETVEDDIVEDDIVADDVEAAEIESAEAEPEHEGAVAQPAREPGRDGEAAREGGRRRRRGRGGRGRGRGTEPREGAPAAPPFTHETVPEHAIAHEDHDAGSPEEDAGGEPMERPPLQAGGEGDANRDGRHRRRRGRRGGRRNRRRNGNGETPFISNDGQPEPDLQHAVEDLDRPPAGDREPGYGRESPPSQAAPSQAARDYAPPAEQRPAPAPAPEQAASEPDTPRRRSTVREPASFGKDSAPAPSPTLPPPTPVISSTAADNAGTPKRGWWGKRLLGDKD